MGSLSRHILMFMATAAKSLSGPLGTFRANASPYHDRLVIDNKFDNEIGDAAISVKYRLGMNGYNEANDFAASLEKRGLGPEHIEKTIRGIIDFSKTSTDIAEARRKARHLRDVLKKDDILDIGTDMKNARIFIEAPLDMDVYWPYIERLQYGLKDWPYNLKEADIDRSFNPAIQVGLRILSDNDYRAIKRILLKPETNSSARVRINHQNTATLNMDISGFLPETDSYSDAALSKPSPYDTDPVKQEMQNMMGGWFDDEDDEDDLDNEDDDFEDPDEEYPDDPDEDTEHPFLEDDDDIFTDEDDDEPDDDDAGYDETNSDEDIFDDENPRGGGGWTRSDSGWNPRPR